MDRWRSALGTALVGSLLSTAPAVAGTYDVNACATSAGTFTNHSWGLAINGPQFHSVSCQASEARPYVSIESNANNLYDPGQGATMTFSAPSGTTIVNFWLHRYLFHFNPTGNSGREYLYTVGQLGAQMF